MARPLAAVLTLGCKLNLADSEEIAHGLRTAGFDVVDTLCEADAYVVNTCSVTHVADRKARRLVRSVRRISPSAAVTVTGCFPRSAGHEAVLELGADLVVGTRDADKQELVAFLAGRPALARESATPPSGPPTPGLHTRAFVKAQEGCNDVCAFCIVPRTRGREESRPASLVVREVGRAVEAGAREVVITGTQLGAWGRDFDPPMKPHHLIAAILEETDVPRLRFSSLQPQDITPELLALWSDPRLMPHFHLALQSGSERVLRSMRRRYTAAQFLDAAARIRAAIPAVAITTDVIAGFPGETEQDFQATLALCEQVGFERIHAFPYSRRAQTAANLMPGQIPEQARRERMDRLLALARTLGERHVERYRGALRPVLFEESRPDPGEWRAAKGSHPVPGSSFLWTGLTDNYIRVYARGHRLQNRVTPMVIGERYHEGAWGHFPGGGP
jgi:threonylcarbamoyladenosine tRNA methylthiotransferase MtaB